MTNLEHNLEDVVNSRFKNSFYNLLFRAIVHADEMNLENLRCGFPVEVNMVEIWRKTAEFDEQRATDMSIKSGAIKRVGGN